MEISGEKLEIIETTSHFLTFTSDFTPMVIFLTDSDKTDDFNFAIINFPHLDSNKPTALTYRISQHMCYAQPCSLYSDFYNVTIF